MIKEHSPKQRVRKCFLWALLAAVFFSGVWVVATNRSFVARNVLEQFHLPRVAEFLNPNDARLHFAIGNYYFGGSNEYDVERAEYFYRRALAEDSFYPRARYQLARTLFIKGNFYAAEREINKELEQYPDFWRSYYVRALVRGYNGNLPGAAEDFEEFLRHKPESWAAHNDLAWAYFRLGEYAKVRDTALEGLVYAPENPWLNNALGVALHNLGDKEGANVALLRAETSAGQMTALEWGMSYPGNDPRIYEGGLEAMQTSIKENLALLESL